jgi:hypothetical protein
VHPHGGSELNDSRQAIQIVQRGRVRRKQAHVPSRMRNPADQKKAQEHEPWTSRSHLEQAQRRSMTRKHRRKQSGHWRIPRQSVRGTELFRQEDMRAIVMPTRVAALPRRLGSGSDSAPAVPRLDGHTPHEHAELLVYQSWRECARTVVCDVLIGFRVCPARSGTLTLGHKALLRLRARLAVRRRRHRV